MHPQTSIKTAEKRGSEQWTAPPNSSARETSITPSKRCYPAPAPAEQALLVAFDLIEIEGQDSRRDPIEAAAPSSPR